MVKFCFRYICTSLEIKFLIATSLALFLEPSTHISTSPNHTLLLAQDKDKQLRAFKSPAVPRLGWTNGTICLASLGCTVSGDVAPWQHHSFLVPGAERTCAKAAPGRGVERTWAASSLLTALWCTDYNLLVRQFLKVAGEVGGRRAYQPGCQNNREQRIRCFHVANHNLFFQPSSSRVSA